MLLDGVMVRAVGLDQLFAIIYLIGGTSTENLLNFQTLEQVCVSGDNFKNN